MRRIAALLLLVAAPLMSQTAHPDLSGKWSLDAAARGVEAAGVTATVTIAQTEKSIKIDQDVKTPAGDNHSSLTFAIDGNPSKNTVDVQGRQIEMNSTTAWEGSTLVVTTTADVGVPVKSVERWSLDETGKKLTLSSDIDAAGQTMSRKQVFNKS
jgi:hypothetical protein